METIKYVQIMTNTCL